MSGGVGGGGGVVVPLEVGTPGGGVPVTGGGDTLWTTHDVSNLLNGGTNVYDALRQIAAQDQSVILPPAVNFYEEDDGAGNAVRFAAFDVWIIPIWWLVNEDLTYTITPIGWKETGTALASNELPFRDLKLGFNLGELVTNAGAEDTTGTRYSSTNTVNNDTFGSRSSEITNANATKELGVGFSTVEILRATGATVGTRSYAQEYTNRTTEWFDRTEFGPLSWEISGGMIYNEATSTAPVKKLLEAPYGSQGPLYRCMTMDATGAGGATMSFAMTATKVSLSIGANDWVMRFDDSISSSTAFGFILDDTDFGVLDVNRV